MELESGGGANAGGLVRLQGRADGGGGCIPGAFGYGAGTRYTYDERDRERDREPERRAEHSSRPEWEERGSAAAPPRRVRHMGGAMVWACQLYVIGTIAYQDDRWRCGFF